MSKGQEEDDVYFEAIVQDDYNRAAPPPLSKEQAWERIQYELAAASVVIPRRTKVWRALSKQWRNAVVALLVIGIGFYALHEKKDVSFSLASKQAASTMDANEDFKVVTENAKYVAAAPKYVPEGYAFSHVNALTNSDSPNIQVVLIYMNGKTQLSITRYFKNQRPGPDSNTIGQVEKTQVMLGKTQADLYTFKDGSLMMTWDVGDVHLIVRGKLTKSEMLKLGESL